MNVQEKSDFKVITKKIKTSIRVKAFESELLDLGLHAAAISSDTLKLEEEKKTSAQQFKDDIDTKKAELKRAFEQISNGQLYINNADCVEEWNSTLGLYRLWWGERLIDERAMTLEERTMHQDNIFNMKDRKPAETQYTYSAEEDEIKQIMQEEKSAKRKKDHLT